MSKDGDKLMEIKHDHAWEHFKLHANQRVTLFRFYVIFATFFLASVGFYLKEKLFENELLSYTIFLVVFGILFFIITLVFHFLDRRNQQLIGYSKEALKEFEKTFLKKNKNRSEDNKKFFVFVNDDEKEKKLSHASSYLILFIAGYILAGLSILVSIIICTLHCCIK